MKLWAWTLVALAAACIPAQERLRRHTYPPGFQYETSSAVDARMISLAKDAFAVDQLARTSPVSESDRQRILEILGRMAETAHALDSPGRTTNHPLLDHNLDSFRAQLELARAAAAHDPPSYYLTGSVAGSCLICHGAEPRR